VKGRPEPQDQKKLPRKAKRGACNQGGGRKKKKKTKQKTRKSNSALFEKNGGPPKKERGNADEEKMHGEKPLPLKFACSRKKLIPGRRLFKPALKGEGGAMKRD